MLSKPIAAVQPDDIAAAFALAVTQDGGVAGGALDLLQLWLGARQVRIDRAAGAHPPRPRAGRACRPLRFGDEQLGWLIVEADPAAAPVDPATLDTVAATCALALAGAGRRTEADARAGRVREALGQIRRFLAERPDTGRLMQVLAETALSVVGADAAAVGLIDVESHEIALRATAGAQQAELSELLRVAGSRFSSPVLQQLRPLAVALAADDAVAASRGQLATLAIVPLQARHRAIGAIAVAAIDPGAIDQRDLDALAELAEEGALATENARLFDALQDRLVELSALHEVSKAFNTLGDLEAALSTLVTRIAELMGAARCVVMLLSDDRSELVATQPAYGLTAEEVARLRVPFRENSAGHRVWQSGEPYISNDATAAGNAHLAEYAQRLHDQTLLIAPLQVGGRPLGVIRVSNKRAGRFSRADARLLTVLATQAAAVIENERLFATVEHEREMLRAVFEHTSDGIVVVDENRRVVTFNTAMERLTGYAASEMIGQFCHARYQCLSEGGHPICTTACPLTLVMDGDEQIPYFETRFATREGGLRDVAVSYSVVPSPSDPAKRYAISVSRDISHLKEIERAKSEFISTVSHELRTPLAAIQSSIGVLRDHAPATLPEPLQRLVANIDRSSQRLNTIVSDLLELAYLQNGRIEIHRRWIDLRGPVEDAVATVRPLAERRRQTLEVDAPHDAVYGLGDRGRIEQITLNLLSNAVKYTPDGGSITVRIVGDGRQATIAITDSGPGIPPGETARIFERFYRRSDAATQRSTGSGLGLPIARALVELHGGKIWVDSTPGQGSTFSFTIPSLRPAPLMNSVEH